MGLTIDIPKKFLPPSSVDDNQELRETIKKQIASHAFCNSIDDLATLKKIKQLCDKFKYKKHFVHIGIGGSSLGPEMLIKSLGDQSQKNITFINNIDPDEISSQLKAINIKEAIFSFVSKSGSTVETIASLNLITNLLQNNDIGPDKLKDYFVFTTDPNQSELKNIAEKYDIELLFIPPKIGGRFSALAAVGLFPAAFIGINIEDLLQGAKTIQNDFFNPNKNQDLLTTATYLVDLKHSKSINQTVFMPYSSKLKEVSLWFTQLWAESLGKKYDLEGKTIYTGLTPIPAFGATDQHSQMQLFMEGPKDKCLILLEVESFQSDFSLKSTLNEKTTNLLSPHTLSELMKAQLNGTKQALEKADRPFLSVKITRRDASHLGELIMWLEALTATVGHLLKIDPFNQPGVESAKRYAKKWLTDNSKSHF